MSSGMICKRCGADESRIDGFCSIECRDKFYYEEEIAELTARAEKAEAMVERLIEAIELGREVPLMHEPEITVVQLWYAKMYAIVTEWREGER